MWAASGRKIRMITVPGSCLVVLSGHWCVMAWAVPKAAARPHRGPAMSSSRLFQEQYAQCGAGQEGAFLKKALISANRYVFNKAAHEESLAGMGTTQSAHWCGAGKPPSATRAIPAPTSAGAVN